MPTSASDTRYPFDATAAFAAAAPPAFSGMSAPSSATWAFRSGELVRLPKSMLFCRAGLPATGTLPPPGSFSGCTDPEAAGSTTSALAGARESKRRTSALQLTEIPDRRPVIYKRRPSRRHDRATAEPACRTTFALVQIRGRGSAGRKKKKLAERSVHMMFFVEGEDEGVAGGVWPSTMAGLGALPQHLQLKVAIRPVLL